MAVKMRLMRMGKKKQPMYRVVVIDGRSPRDGRYIEQIGRYAPLEDPSLVEIDNEKATQWLAKGAQPTEAVEKLLNISGAMNTMKVKTGQIHTVGGTPPPSAESDSAEAEQPDTPVDTAEEAVAEAEQSDTPADTAGEAVAEAEAPSESVATSSDDSTTEEE
jgi:small subunit ribosomal protein S16